MKRKGCAIFLIISILTILTITGIVVYSFYLQMKEDQLEQIDEGNSPVSPEPTFPPSKGFDDPYDPDSTTPTPATNPEILDPSDNPSGDPYDNPLDSDSIKDTKNEIILAFAGDVSLDDNAKTVARYDRENKGLKGAFSQDLIDEMQNADIFMLNNEFAFSTRGTKTPNKEYTFRANPSRVQILKDMGTDIVSLANNHSLDYGQDALLDTFTTLEDAEIDYVGAGRNMERAKAAKYYEVGDTTIAYLSASKVIFSVDWYASSNKPGMFGTYDPTMLIAGIKEAKTKSDYVIVYVHWGKEREQYPEDWQIKMAKQYIDAGADAVIGAHPHVLQGLEFYQGKIIAYSLGNYWFNGKTSDTGLLKLYLTKDGQVKIQLLPAIQDNAYTSLLTEEAAKNTYYETMKKLSYDVDFDEEGFATPSDKGTNTP